MRIIEKEKWREERSEGESTGPTGWGGRVQSPSHTSDGGGPMGWSPGRLGSHFA